MKCEIIFIRFRALYTAACIMLLAICCFGQEQYSTTIKTKDSLKEFLRKYAIDPYSGEDKTTEYSFAFVSLSGSEKKEVIVYISGQTWCGSGGCIMLILKPTGSSYKIISKITIVRSPIRMLQSTTNGWHDIGVWVQGGGIRHGYEAVLAFNGKKYPGNPSVPPARRLSQKTEGEIVISGQEKTTPLYQ